MLTQDGTQGCRLFTAARHSLLAISFVCAGCGHDTVTSPAPTDAPTAAFSAQCQHLICTFVNSSTDADGAIEVYAWDFGDGGTSTQRDATHTYAAPGGQFTVTLVVTDDRGASATATKQVNAVMSSAPDRSGIYERETSHGVPGRHSRYVIRADGRFELHDGTERDSTIYTGRWKFGNSWGGWPLEPSEWVVFLDFDGFAANQFCGEAYGVFLLDGHLAIAYCGMIIQAGLEEGVYTKAPDVGTPSLPPPQTGEIAFVRDGRIYRANSDGTGLVQLSTGPNDQTPAWSPDGSRIAFAGSGGVDGGGVFIMDRDGSNLVQLTSSGSEPAWSPDGKWIAFRCFTSGDTNICTKPVDDETATPVNVTKLRGQVSAPSWAPDGTRIAFTSDWAMFDFWFDTWVIAPDGSQLTALRTHTPLTPNPTEQHQPAWSPDGRRIAYVECPWAWNVCSSSVIGVMNADGTGAVRLVAASGYAHPSWSPGGQVIAFGSANTIQWVSADGSQRGIIISNGHSPAWRP